MRIKNGEEDEDDEDEDDDDDNIMRITSICSANYINL